SASTCKAWLKPRRAASRRPAMTAPPLPWLTGRLTRCTSSCLASCRSTWAQGAWLASSTSTQGRPARSRLSTTDGTACSWLYTGITAQALCTGSLQQNAATGAGLSGAAVGEVQLAALGIEAQGQCQ